MGEGRNARHDAAPKTHENQLPDFGAAVAADQVFDAERTRVDQALGAQK